MKMILLMAMVVLLLPVPLIESDCNIAPTATCTGGEVSYGYVPSASDEKGTCDANCDPDKHCKAKGTLNMTNNTAGTIIVYGPGSQTTLTPFGTGSDGPLNIDMTCGGPPATWLAQGIICKFFLTCVACVHDD